MVKYWNITIPTLSEDKERLAYVYLPESYEHNTQQRYPVLYMFDGHNLFFDHHATYGKSWGLKEYLDETHTPLIVAAVECNHDSNHGRLKEYAPFSFFDSRIGRIEGKGYLTMEWLIHVFKPYIDSNFRTLSDREHTMIAGSSMGGLMSLYGVLHHNETFSRAAALSPSLWCCFNPMKRLASSATLYKDTVIYMDYGIKEYGNHLNIIHDFGEFSTLLMMRNISVDCRTILEGTHCEASWQKQIPFFMNTLFYHLQR